MKEISIKSPIAALGYGFLWFIVCIMLPFSYGMILWMLTGGIEYGILSGISWLCTSILIMAIFYPKSAHYFAQLTGSGMFFTIQIVSLPVLLSFACYKTTYNSLLTLITFVIITLSLVLFHAFISYKNTIHDPILATKLQNRMNSIDEYQAYNNKYVNNGADEDFVLEQLFKQRQILTLPLPNQDVVTLLVLQAFEDEIYCVKLHKWVEFDNHETIILRKDQHNKNNPFTHDLLVLPHVLLRIKPSPIKHEHVKLESMLSDKKFHHILKKINLILDCATSEHFIKKYIYDDNGQADEIKKEFIQTEQKSHSMYLAKNFRIE